MTDDDEKKSVVLVGKARGLTESHRRPTSRRSPLQACLVCCCCLHNKNCPGLSTQYLLWSQYLCTHLFIQADAVSHKNFQPAVHYNTTTYCEQNDPPRGVGMYVREKNSSNQYRYNRVFCVCVGGEGIIISFPTNIYPEHQMHFQKCSPMGSTV